MSTQLMRETGRTASLSAQVVYRIVAGVVFHLIAEGMARFGRYAAIRTEKIVAGSELYGNYHRFASVINAADSVGMTEGSFDDCLMLLSSEKPLAMLQKSDSFMIIIHKGVIDTLFDCVKGLEFKRKTVNHISADTLAVTLERKDGHLMRMAFTIEPRPEKIIQQNTEEREKQYHYGPRQEKSERNSRHNP